MPPPQLEFRSYLPDTEGLVDRKGLLQMSVVKMTLLILFVSKGGLCKYSVHVLL